MKISDVPCTNAWCHSTFYVVDTVIINGEEVDFLACVKCFLGYTRCGKDLEKIT